MNNNTITLEKNVFERDLQSFLSKITKIKENDKIDFQHIGYYMPAAITSLLCHLLSRKYPIKWENLLNNDSSGFRYFQRMNFFKFLFPDINIQENFCRHFSVNFSPIIKIDKDSNENDISEKILSTIWGKRTLSQQEEPNIKRTVQYAIGEIVRNVIQHSESHGYIASQFYPATGLIRIGISDTGIGILESFKKNESPYFTNEDNHLSMLNKAIKKQVSSKTHKPLPPYSTGHENKGVGLSMMKALTKLTSGYFFMATGDSYYLSEGDKTPNSGYLNGFYQGTICSIAISRNQLDKYPYDMLRSDLFKEVFDSDDSDNISAELFL